MKKYNSPILFCFFLVNAFIGRSQIISEKIDSNLLISSAISENITKYNLEKISPQKLKKEDLKSKILYRTGICEKVDFNLKSLGSEIEIPSKGSLYRMNFSSDSATGIGFSFVKFNIPKGAYFFLQNKELKIISGAFGSANNNSDSILNTINFPYNELILNYYEPNNTDFKGDIIIGTIIQRYVEDDKKKTENISSENHGINCSLGENYQDIKHSVCRITFHDNTYEYTCTATLINNQLNDATPYLLTAAHCIDNEALAKTVVAYFNYETQECTSNILNSNTISGANLKISIKETDCSLIKLSTNIPNSYQVLYAGWDASEMASNISFCIHHPEGKPKSIDITNESIIDVSDLLSWDEGSVNKPFTHWGAKFTNSTIVGGSSGSALFNFNKQIIGQLHGGNDEIEYFGKFSNSYALSETLRNLLDPLKNGKLFCNSFYTKSIPIPAVYTRTPTVCFGEACQLINTSLFFPDSCQWDISPGNFHYEQGYNKYSFSPRIIFETSNNYSIKLTVWNSFGKRNKTFSNLIKISDNISIKSLNFPQDSALCTGQLPNYPLIFSGAEKFEFDTNNSPTEIETNDSSFLVKYISNTAKNTYTPLLVSIKGISSLCSQTIKKQLYILPASNDSLEKPLEIELGKNGPFMNKCASSQDNEPKPNIGFCTAEKYWCNENVYSANTIQNSLWFKYKAQASGNLQIQSQGIDNQIAVYEANKNETHWQTNNTLIAANDDQTANTKEAKIEECKVTAGENYWIQVDGSKGGIRGTFYLTLYQDITFISPNPNNGIFTITLNTIERENINLEIFNSIGRKIYSAILPNSESKTELNVNLNTPESGIYFVKCSNNKQQWCQKISIQKKP